MNPQEEDNQTLKRTLTYANGYRELGMFHDALAELSQLPEKLASRLETLRMKLAIFFDAADWPAAECVAKEIALREPSDPGSFINLAFATRRSKSIVEAKEILETAAAHFSNEAIIHYNLACYDCMEKDHESAKKRLIQAISLDPIYLNTAKSDEDLKALSDWLENLEIA